MRNPAQEKEINLYFEFKKMEVQSCNFNLSGKLILFCTIDNLRNLVCVYSRQTTQNKNNKWMRQNIYKVPKRAELISISKYDKILLRLNHQIYEWNLLTGYTMMVLKGIYEVIIHFQIQYVIV